MARQASPLHSTAQLPTRRALPSRSMAPTRRCLLPATAREVAMTNCSSWASQAHPDQVRATELSAKRPAAMGWRPLQRRARSSRHSPRTLAHDLFAFLLAPESKKEIAHATLIRRLTISLRDIHYDFPFGQVRQSAT
jgi:hypothetical protein